MRLFRFLIALCLLSALLWGLSVGHVVGSNALPPLGRFFNPFSGFWRNAEPLAGISGRTESLRIPGLKGPVEVVYDDLMTPHIFAGNIEDALMAQGYITAQFRLWQMDMTARRVGGRLSEVLGARTTEIDRMTRRRGLPWAAERCAEAWKNMPGGLRMLSAYAAGVNAWIEQLDPKDYPLEFKLLNYKPEAWDEYKCALALKGMADMLCAREDDLAATNTLAQLGPETFNYLFPEWNPRQQPIISDAGQWKSIKAPDFSPASPPAKGDQTRLSMLDAIPERRLPSSARDMVGSNNWAVSAAKTIAGHPLLANDPHLGLTLPSIWFQVQIHAPEFNCYGVSLPGLPGIVVGFNENMAWGVTNVGHDVLDWYRIKWADPTRSAYLLDGKAIKTEQRIETIYVKDGQALLDTVRYTVWGPVVYDDPKQALHDCAMRWVAHDQPEGNVMEAFLHLDGGKGYDDYQKALGGYEAPAQNFVFAAVDGDIAMQVQGKFPLRARQQGRYILDGSDSKQVWHGFIPQEHVPNMRNPSRGFVFSANQHSTPPSYPYYYIGDFEDFRSRRIYQRLDQTKGATIDTMKAMQLDNFSQKAADALPALLRLLDRKALDPAEQALASQLENWDYNYDRDAVAPSLFDMWYDSCYLRTWDEMDSLRQRKISVLFPDGWRFIELLERDTNNIFFDHPATPQRENARNIVSESFRQMAQQAAKQAALGKLNWGKFRGFTLRHLARIDGFSRADIAVGGHRNAPNAISREHGPSWRMIVELGRPVRAVGIYPGGQSGNPGSKYYDHFVEKWAEGQYDELLLMKNPDDIPAARLLKRVRLDNK